MELCDFWKGSQRGGPECLEGHLVRQQAASETARRRGGQTTKTRRPCQKAEAECGSLERMCDAFLKGESQRPHATSLFKLESILEKQKETH